MSIVFSNFAPHSYVLDTNLDLELALDHQRVPTQNSLPSNTHPPSSADNPHYTELRVRSAFEEDAYRCWRWSRAAWPVRGLDVMIDVV